MANIKIKGTQLFDGYRFITDSTLIINHQKEIIDIVPDALSGDDILYFNGIIAPGFINCHCHLELSHLKNSIPEKTGLTGFVQQVVKNRYQEKEKIHEAIYNADAEMWQNGIVAVGDICNTTDTISAKLQSPIQYQNFIEAYSFIPEKVKDDFQKYASTYHQFKKYFAQTSLVPHAPYSVNPTLWDTIMALPNNDLISIHNQETAAEDEWFKYGTGAFKTMYENMQVPLDAIPPTGSSSIQSYLPILKNKKVIAVHNVYTSSADIEFASHLLKSIYWCFCFNANKYITDQFPNLPNFIQQKQPFVLGTDSLASNWQLNIWDEIKTGQNHFTISLEQWLHAATIQGAKALQMDRSLGSFEKGKTPGINLITEKGVQKIF